MALTSPPAAGAALRASVLQALISERTRLWAVKGANTSRNTTIVLADDPDLTVTVVANATYQGMFVLGVDSAANAAGDLAIGLNFPAGCTVTIGGIGADISLASAAVSTQSTRLSTISAVGTTNQSFGASTLATTVFLPFVLSVAGTGGAFTLQWCQNTSNANNTRLLTGSYMELWRVA